MKSSYVYFTASLPMLHEGARPPFSWQEFLDRCAEFLPMQDVRVLAGLPEASEYPAAQVRNLIIRKVIDFDTALRNELARTRARRLHTEAKAFLRGEELPDAEIAHTVAAAIRNPSPIESEKILDHARWVFLESMSCGHYFDLDAMIVYAYKLKILHRWEAVRVADHAGLVSAALSKGA